MSPDLISKQELLAAGWNERQIDAALDRPDEVRPSGHWLNTYGKPYFLRERVAVAAYRIGLAEQKPEASIWEKWVNHESPTFPPELTFDFHRLAGACLPGSSRELGRLRISHPVLGRLPGTRDKETKLIKEILIALVGQAFGVVLAGTRELNRFLSERADNAAELLGDPWPEGIEVRRANRSSYVSRATGTRAMQRFINALAFVHAGRILSHDGRILEVTKLLIYAPTLRFDRKGDLHAESNESGQKSAIL